MSSSSSIESLYSIATHKRKKLAKCDKKQLEIQFLEAADKCDLKTIRRCLDLKVNPNVKSPDGLAAIHIGADRGDVALARELMLWPNIDVNIYTNHGYTPLGMATQFGFKKFIELLLEYGADPNKQDRHGKTPLHVAATRGFLDVGQTLLKYNAEVNVMDQFDNTPLSISLLDKPCPPLTALLLAYGADISLNSGRSMHLFLECVLVCFTEEQLETIDYLTRQDFDINMVDQFSNRNALHHVAISGYTPLARLLVERGVDPNKTDALGKKPIDIARAHENLEIFDFFQSLQYNPQNSSDDIRSVG